MVATAPSDADLAQLVGNGVEPIMEITFEAVTSRAIKPMQLTIKLARGFQRQRLPTRITPYVVLAISS